MSNHDPDTRRTVDSILKTSAILAQFGGSQYEYMVAPAAPVAPAVTAMTLK